MPRARLQNRGLRTEVCRATCSWTVPATVREASRFVGTIGPDVHALLKLLAKAGDPARVSVVYEAGPTGYGLYRELCRRGYRCEIVAPSLIPRRPGDRIKNDRRDCLRLAERATGGPSPLQARARADSRCPRPARCRSAAG